MEGESSLCHVNSQSTSPRSQGSHPISAEMPFSHKRLLVVDDNEDIHLLMEDRLETRGYGVIRATNGVEALDVLGMIPVDGVLLDIEMPVMDGLMLLRELQEQHIHVPVIVMSAGSDPQKFAQAIELGAMDYLKKPIDTLLLIEKCERLFG